VTLTSDAATLRPASYWPALDGLRGVAILMVVGFHLPFGPFRAGSFGVILFFVLSGFLITTILLRELDEKGTVNLRRFYARRARRLFPALLVVVAAHLVLQVTVLGEPQSWWDRSWPVLAYVSNYVQIGGTQLVHMAHTWSLAIEEHFYLLWPVTLLVLPRRWRFPATCALVLVFTAWRLRYLTTGAPHDRIYFATDTNAFAPLLGCALALGLHERRIPQPTHNMSVLSTVALILAACIPWHYYDRRLLYFTLPVAILAVLSIHGTLSKPTLWLESPVLRWFGKVSYGLYLWHYMLISLPWERLLPIPPVIPMIVTPIALAAMSWRYVEAPLLGRRARGRPSPVTQESDAPQASLDPAPQPQALTPIAVVDGSRS
jgi:peptidoglycan/LPS O-acetylase OafA/YrhL